MLFEESIMKSQLFFVLIVLFVLVATTQAQSTRQEARPDSVTLDSNVELPLNVTGHLPVIEAKINGKGPFKFAVDTGFGGAVELNQDVSSKLALPQIGEARTGDPSGRNPQTLKVLKADTVEIGTAHFKGVSVIERPARRGPAEADGMIGLNLFYSLLVQFDYVNGKFRVLKGEINNGILYNTDHGVPNIEIEVNGQKTKVDIDSGSPAMVSLPLSLAKTLTLAAEPKVVGKGRTMDGEFDVYTASLKGEIRIGSIVLKDPQIDMVSVFPVGNLGYQLLKTLDITFDPANRRVRLEKSKN